MYPSFWRKLWPWKVHRWPKSLRSGAEPDVRTRTVFSNVHALNCDTKLSPHPHLDLLLF